MTTDSNLLLAFGLTLIAGLSTGIGSLIAFLAKKTNTRFLSAALGLSAGVMIYVSFMELMPESVAHLQTLYSEKTATAFMLTAFFLGIGFIALIDKLVPEDENPHEMHSSQDAHPQRLKRTGVMMALAIGIHNFPEGLATFTSALANIEVALPIVFAIAIHNIPEGIAVAVPLYYGTGSRKKALFYSFLSGLAEPVGAAIAMFFLFHFLTPTVLAVLFASVAGIMVFISFDELLPMAERWGHHHISIMGIIAGMLLMAIVLI